LKCFLHLLNYVAFLRVKVGGDKAMALLYYGAAARSTLSAYGTLTDFTNQVQAVGFIL